MENQDHKSNWDDLARELGAQIAPEIEQREKARLEAINEPQQSVEPSRSRKSTVITPPKRAAADWNKLAGDLGLSPLEPEPPVVEERQVEAVEEAARASVPDRPREPRQRESGDRRESREGRESRERHPEGQRRERHTESKQRQRRTQKERGGDRERESRREKTHEQRESRREREVARHKESGPEKPAAPVEEPPKSPAVSLWQKIFGSPAEQPAKATGQPKPQEFEDTLSRSPEEEQVFVEFENESYAAVDEAHAGATGEDQDSRSDREEWSNDAEAKRGRSRRRRRGGRGRRSRERRDVVEGEANDPDRHPQGELEEDFEDLNVADSDDEGQVSHEDSDQYGDEQLNGTDSEARQSGRSRAAQRAIPSWEEAVGFIVDMNMQGRSERRSQPRQSRGRPRGRRRS